MAGLRKAQQEMTRRLLLSTERTWTPGQWSANLESTLEVLAASWVGLLTGGQP